MCYYDLKEVIDQDTEQDSAKSNADCPDRYCGICCEAVQKFPD